MPKQINQHVSIVIKLVMMCEIVLLYDAFIVNKTVLTKTNNTTATATIVTQIRRFIIIKDDHITSQQATITTAMTVFIPIMVIVMVIVVNIRNRNKPAQTAILSNHNKTHSTRVVMLPFTKLLNSHQIHTDIMRK